jgi:hypothetical protein
VDTTRIPPAGDPFTSAPRRTRSTRHHRCTHEFLELLEEDFGIPGFTLSNAFMGVPAESKKSAIALCEWAIRCEDPARALLAWARKNHRGTFRPSGAEDHPVVGDDL